MTSRLTIALDYDKTYDADNFMWDSFIALAESHGHKVVLVAFRDENYDKTPLLLELEKNIEVYYTGGVAKRWWCQHFGPGEIDIWIDDNPHSITDNSKFTPEALAEWRVGDKQVHYPS